MKRGPDLSGMPPWATKYLPCHLHVNWDDFAELFFFFLKNKFRVSEGEEVRRAEDFVGVLNCWKQRKAFIRDIFARPFFPPKICLLSTGLCSPSINPPLNESYRTMNYRTINSQFWRRNTFSIYNVKYFFIFSERGNIL